MIKYELGAGIEPALTVIGSIIPEISTRSFRRILGGPFQPRPNDPIECLGIAEVIFLREIKLFGPFRPISGIVSGMKNGALFFWNRELRVGQITRWLRMEISLLLVQIKNLCHRSRRRSVKIQVL